MTNINDQIQNGLNNKKISESKEMEKDQELYNKILDSIDKNFDNLIPRFVANAMNKAFQSMTSGFINPNKFQNGNGNIVIVATNNENVANMITNALNHLGINFKKELDTRAYSYQYEGYQESVEYEGVNAEYVFKLVSLGTNVKSDDQYGKKLEDAVSEMYSKLQQNHSNTVFAETEGYYFSSFNVNGKFYEATGSEIMIEGLAYNYYIKPYNKKIKPHPVKKKTNYIGNILSSPLVWVIAAALLFLSSQM